MNNDKNIRGKVRGHLRGKGKQKLFLLERGRRSQEGLSYLIDFNPPQTVLITVFIKC